LENFSDKLRKFVRFVWLIKERLVLAVMVVFLCQRVYRVLNPGDPPQQDPLPPPKRTLEDLPPEELPPEPPPVPPIDIPGTYSSLVKRNPFWYYGGQGGQTDDEVSAADLGLALIDIKPLGGRVRVRLQTRSTTKWYDVGEQFEEFELISADPDLGTVEVFSEQYNRSFILEME